MRPAGAITGTPTTAVTNTSLTFTVTDSGSPKLTKSVNLTLSTLASVSVVVSPNAPALTVGQALNLSATIQDNVGVTWSASGSSCSGTSCGVFSSATSKSGVTVTTPPPQPPAITPLPPPASPTPRHRFHPVGVTDLAGVPLITMMATETA